MNNAPPMRTFAIFSGRKTCFDLRECSETKGLLCSKALAKDLTYESDIAYLRSINKVVKSPAQHVAGLVTCAFFKLDFLQCGGSFLNRTMRSDH